jgi:DsbC/DsbD-like thiol-disulfide interchange protein
MTPAFRTLLLALGVSTFACGGSGPGPADPAREARAKREREAREKAEAEEKKASRIAKLETDEPAERMPEAVVQLSFEPLVTGVRPGRKFLLAAHFRIAPGYRISWKNPGDVGKETIVSVRAPAGFEVGDATFPVPERYTVPGGYVGFGYQNETAVFVEVKAPAALSRGAVHRFDLSASWVACKKECATEHTDAFVELATTYGNAAAKEVEASLASFKARLPTPLADVKDAEQKWELGRNATLVVKVPGSTLKEFISDGKAEPAPKKVAISGAEARFVFDDAPRAGSKPLRGLILASAENGGDAFFDLDAATPGDEAGHADKSGASAPSKKAKNKKGARGKKSARR